MSNEPAMPNVAASAESSEALAARARDGDGTALSVLIERVQDEIYRLSLRMLWHPQDAEDATQEILFRIVTSVATFRGESAFRTWAFRVATNHLLNVKRSRVEMQSLTFDSFAKDLADGLSSTAEPAARAADAPDQVLLEEEVKIGCTQAMLLCLDRDERIAYILGDVFELASPEADDVLDIEPAAFRKRLSRARAQIREFMEANCGLIGTRAACRCARRVASAVARVRVNPGQLLFAGKGIPSPRRLPILEAVGEMERLYDLAAVHQSHPQFQSPERVAASVRRVLETVSFRVLR
jgi:RNA polymerase sigma factor (sigma-70 family)